MWLASLACMMALSSSTTWAQSEGGDMIDVSLTSTYKIAGLTVLGAAHTAFYSNAPPRLVYHRAGGLTPLLGEPLMSLPPGLENDRPVWLIVGAAAE